MRRIRVVVMALGNISFRVEIGVVSGNIGSQLRQYYISNTKWFEKASTAECCHLL